MAALSPLASLEGIGPGLPHLRIELGAEPVRIGRGTNCAVSLADPMVSREHAEIRYQSGTFMITDLGSTHGTFLDGIEVQEGRLIDGSRIRLGNTEFVFQLAQDAIPTAMVGSMPAPPPTTYAPAAQPRESYPAATPPATPPSDAAPTPAPASPTGSPAPAALPPKKRSGRKWAIGCGIIALLSLCGCLAVYLFAVLAESTSGLSQAIDEILAGGGETYTAEDLQLALAEPLPDERGQILERLGRPDEFDISIVEVEGGQVRRETWRYYGFGTQVDFVDGAIVWTVDLDPVPENTVFPAWYDPTVFETGMTVEEGAALAAAASPAGTVPQRIDLSDGGEDLAGGEMLLGDQITLGFQEGSLVYVETIGATLGEAGE